MPGEAIAFITPSYPNLQHDHIILSRNRTSALLQLLCVVVCCCVLLCVCCCVCMLLSFSRAHPPAPTGCIHAVGPGNSSAAEVLHVLHLYGQVISNKISYQTCVSRDLEKSLWWQLWRCAYRHTLDTMGWKLVQIYLDACIVHEFLSVVNPAHSLIHLKYLLTPTTVHGQIQSSHHIDAHFLNSATELQRAFDQHFFYNINVWHLATGFFIWPLRQIINSSILEFIFKSICKTYIQIKKKNLHISLQSSVPEHVAVCFVQRLNE